MSTTLVTGNIIFPPNTKPFSNASIVISLEDTGMLGMPAQIINQKMLQNVSYAGQPLSFSLEGDSISPGNSYNLSIHVRMSRSEEINKGDFITKRGYAILRSNVPDHRDIEVELV